MIYVALGSLLVAALSIVSFVPILRYVIRQGARDRELLVNQVCALAGRPWQEPPSYGGYEPEIVEDDIFAIPEQMSA
jgi:hypothetical protein